MTTVPTGRKTPVTEVEVWQPTGSASRAGALVEWADAAQAAHILATSLVKTQIVPDAFRGKAAEATAVILLGAELGLTPIASLRSMFVVKGQVGMYVRTQVGLAQRYGHRIWTEAETDARVVVAGCRADDPEHIERVEWTIERAKMAGLVRRGASGAPSQYELQPRAMLWARAAGEVARRIAADVLAGMPEGDDTPEPAAGAPTGPRRVVERYRGALPIPVGEVLDETTAPPAPASPPASTPDAPNDAAEQPLASASLGEVEDAGESAAEGDDEPETLDVDLPEPTLTPEQRTRLMVEFNARGLKGHDLRIAWLKHFIGRELTSANDLTVTEASAAIERLTWERETAGGDDDDRRS